MNVVSLRDVCACAGVGADPLITPNYFDISLLAQDFLLCPVKMTFTVAAILTK